MFYNVPLSKERSSLLKRQTFSKMKLKKFKEAICDVGELPDFSIKTESIGKHGCSPEQLVAIMNEVLEILQGLQDCLKVADLHTYFVEGFPGKSGRFDGFPDFWEGFDMFVFESAVKFLANEGFVQLEPKIRKNGKVEMKMIIGCHKNARVRRFGEENGWFLIGQSN